MSTATSVDMLAPTASTWARDQKPAAESILDAPRTWREFAASEDKTNPGLAASYRRFADELDRYLEMRGGPR